MPRTGITREQVFAVADRLADQGIAPTVAIVRSDLGKGSFTTINQHLGEWKALKWKAEGLTAALPPAVEGKARESLAVLWEFAAREAGQTIERIREAALRDVSEMQEALEEAQRQCQALGVERQALHKHLDQAHQTIAALTAEIARLSESLGASAKRLEALEARWETARRDRSHP